MYCLDLIAALPFYGIASSLPLSTCAFVSLSLVIVGSLELRLMFLITHPSALSYQSTADRRLQNHGSSWAGVLPI